MIQMFGVLNILDICNQQIDMKIAYSVRNKNNRRIFTRINPIQAERLRKQIYLILDDAINYILLPA